MTDTDDTAPGVKLDGDSPSGFGPGRRRGTDQVGAELAALRRDLTATREILEGHAGHLSETLPKVDELTTIVTGLVAAVTALTAERADEQQADAAELEARRMAGLADEPASPWCWPTMTRPDAQAAWEALDRWAETFCRQHQPSLERLPSCWSRHPGAVAELSALRASHVAALARGAHPAALLAWHRDVPAALDRIRGAIPVDRCPHGLHDVPAGQAPPEREQQRVAALPSTPDAWRPALRQVAEADLAGRREPPAEA